MRTPDDLPPIDLTQQNDPNRQNQWADAGGTVLDAGLTLADGVVAVGEVAATAVGDAAMSVAGAGADAAGAVAGGLAEILGAILGGLS